MPAAPLVTTLVLGGARSGKSHLAERLVLGSGLEPRYVATAEAGDAEMADRIDRHRARRGAGWITREEPLRLAEALPEEAGPDRAVLVDCLTLWLSNILFAGRDLGEETTRLCGALVALPGPVVLVSNEVGLGLVPETPLGRRFRDAQGRLNGAVAAAVPAVLFVAAGLPLTLKAPGGPAGGHPMIDGIDHLVLTVTDLERTLSFYERVLGMTRQVVENRPASLLFGNQKINVHVAARTFEPKARHPTPGAGDFCLVTSRPIAEVQARLSAEGVAVELGPVERNGARGPMTSLYFRDPDDNLVEVSRYRD